MMGILSVVDRHLKPGSPGIIIVTIVAMCVILIDLVVRPEDAMTRWFVVVLGVIFTWRHFVVWRRRKRHGGLELIGTSREVQG